MSYVKNLGFGAIYAPAVAQPVSHVAPPAPSSSGGYVPKTPPAGLTGQALYDWRRINDPLYYVQEKSASAPAMPPAQSGSAWGTSSLPAPARTSTGTQPPVNSAPAAPSSAPAPTQSAIGTVTYGQIAAALGPYPPNPSTLVSVEQNARLIGHLMARNTVTEQALLIAAQQMGGFGSQIAALNAKISSTLQNAASTSGGAQGIQDDLLKIEAEAKRLSDEIAEKAKKSAPVPPKNNMPLLLGAAGIAAFLLLR
jgi:hypothetical protein